jgi:hypothetical protein
MFYFCLILQRWVAWFPALSANLCVRLRKNRMGGGCLCHKKAHIRDESFGVGEKSAATAVLTCIPLFGDSCLEVQPVCTVIHTGS